MLDKTYFCAFNLLPHYPLNVFVARDVHVSGYGLTRIIAQEVTILKVPRLRLCTPPTPTVSIIKNHRGVYYPNNHGALPPILTSPPYSATPHPTPANNFWTFYTQFSVILITNRFVPQSLLLVFITVFVACVYRTSELDREGCQGVNGYYVTTDHLCYYNECPRHLTRNNRCYRARKFLPAQACKNGFYRKGYCYYNKEP